MKICTVCAQEFWAPRLTGGRPRTRCDDCRTIHQQVDGKAWRTIRKVVLAEEPVCVVAGCQRPSTEVDHIVPLSRGGAATERDNLQGMCKHHNSSKGARLMMTNSALSATAGRWVL